MNHQPASGATGPNPNPALPAAGAALGNANSSNGAQRRSRKRIIIPLVLVLIIAGAVGVYWYVNLRGFLSTDDAYIESDPIEISSKIAGRITQLNASEGDTTSAGALLVQLDDTDLRAQEAQAAANLESARSNVTLARVGLQRAQEDFNRAALQLRDKIITQEQYDHARQALELAQAQTEVAVAQVGAVQAQLNVVQTQLLNTRIYAPSGGVAAKRWVVVGDVVQPGQPMYTLYNLQDVWVRANLEETKISYLGINDPVEITVDAYPGRSFRGHVILIGSAAASQFSLIPPNNASGNFTKVTQRVPVKIAVEDLNRIQQPNPLLRPGMSVVIKIRVIAR